jgi:hypothetical protein
LGGLEINDEGSKHTYAFPSYTLDSGSTVTAYTEKGTNSDTELYWELDKPIWNNDGDIENLYDNSEKLFSFAGEIKMKSFKVTLDRIEEYIILHGRREKEM